MPNLLSVMYNTDLLVHIIYLYHVWPKKAGPWFLIYTDLHENKLFYMKTSFLQENKVSDFSYTPVAQFAHQNVCDLPGF